MHSPSQPWLVSSDHWQHLIRNVVMHICTQSHCSVQRPVATLYPTDTADDWFYISASCVFIQKSMHYTCWECRQCNIVVWWSALLWPIKVLLPQWVPSIALTNETRQHKCYQFRLVFRPLHLITRYYNLSIELKKKGLFVISNFQFFPKCVCKYIRYSHQTIHFFTVCMSVHSFRLISVIWVYIDRTFTGR